MKNNNYNICSNCGEKNPLYFLNCKKCHHYTRENVVNINLWETIFQLFDAPKKALKNIIFAVHKNFITILLAFLGIKLYLTSMIIQSALKLTKTDSSYILLNVFTIIIIYSIVILLFSKIITVFLKQNNQETRFKDNLSIIVYSFIPIILASFVLAPIEYGIFGTHWFIYNPSPFLIKAAPAYILAAIESIMFLWSILILFKGFYLQSNSIKNTIIIVGLFFLFEVSLIFYLPYSFSFLLHNYHSYNGNLLDGILIQGHHQYFLRRLQRQKWDQLYRCT